jgi:hypothetical protein
LSARPKPERVLLFGRVFAVAGASAAVAGRGGRGFASNPEILGFAAAQRLVETFGDKAALEEFPDRRGPAGHAFGETPTVQSFEFISSEHYLKPLTTGQIVHWGLAFPFYFNGLRQIWQE